MSRRIALMIAGLSIAGSQPVMADAYDYTTCCGLGDRVPTCNTYDPDIVGYRRCKSYGVWGTALLDPYTFVDIGLTMRHYAASPPPRVLLRTTMPTKMTPHDEDTALMFDQRIGVQFSQALFSALDLEVGNFENFDSSKPGARDFMLGIMGSLGIRGAAGPFSLSFEGTGGVMLWSYLEDTEQHADPILEVRGRADIWLGPWITVGGVLGTSLLDRDNWMAGVYFGLHTWSYAGDR